MKRRTFLRTGAAAATGFTLAGCLSGDTGGRDSTGTTTDGTTTDGDTTTKTTQGEQSLGGTLNVATYTSFVDAPSSSPGAWIKENFETEYPDATIEWQTPENEVNYFIQRKAQNAPVDADAYVGLNVDHLIRIDEKLGGKPLFEPTADALDNYGHVEEGLKFDPKQRAIPYDTGYISLVYDGGAVENPGTFDALAQDRYRGDLIVQNAQSAATGRAFLLWTIHAKGADGYLDYWQRLVDNDVTILGSWDDAYTAYSNGEAPMVVSYSTDQVYAHRSGENLTRHQVGFLDGQGYANPEGMAKFADADNPALAEAFLDYMLRADVQAQIATRNVQFPATDWADLGAEFEKYAFEPDQPVTFTYDELQGNLDEWIENWAREIASK